MKDFRTGAGDAVLGYDATADFSTADAYDSRNVGLLRAADLFHQSIDQAPLAAPDVSIIAGCGLPTITGFDVYDGGVVDLERGSGDGTVPELSAMDRVNAGHDYFVLSGETGIDHTGLTSDARPVALIRNIVDGNYGAALPAGISPHLEDCAFAPQGRGASSSDGDSTVEFTADAAVGLGVYDSGNRYTGVTASGTVVLGIPGARPNGREQHIHPCSGGG